MKIRKPYLRTTTILLSLLCNCILMAQSYPTMDDLSMALTSITKTDLSTDNQYNFKHFEIDVSHDGEYYIKFWALPAQLADGSFSNFIVYLNDSIVGHLITDQGNWQTLSLNPSQPLFMKKGTNTVSVATLAPEIPAIESAVISENEQLISFPESEYHNYLSDSKANTNFQLIFNDNSATSVNGISDINTKSFYDIPVVYTFFNTFSFTKGQEICLTSSSMESHTMDICFFWTYKNSIVTARNLFSQ